MKATRNGLMPSTFPAVSSVSAHNRGRRLNAYVAHLSLNHGQRALVCDGCCTEGVAQPLG
jgi:hypothetical protein